MSSLQRQAVNEALANDDVSSDAELVWYFISEVGLTEAEAESAVSQRDAFLADALS